jgi:hypothetical protein
MAGMTVGESARCYSGEFLPSDRGAFDEPTIRLHLPDIARMNNPPKQLACWTVRSFSYSAGSRHGGRATI